jgi:hypothetical protein
MKASSTTVEASATTAMEGGSCTMEAAANGTTSYSTASCISSTVGAITTASIVATATVESTTTPVSAMAPAPTVPGTNAEEDAAIKPGRAVVAIGCASVGIVRIVAVCAGWRAVRRITAVVAAIITTIAADSDTNGNLRVRAGCGNEEKSKNCDNR